MRGIPAGKKISIGDLMKEQSKAKRAHAHGR